MPIIKSDISIAAKGTMTEKVKSFLMKGKNIIPAKMGVKFGGCGMILLRTKIKVIKNISPKNNTPIKKCYWEK